MNRIQDYKMLLDIGSLPSKIEILDLQRTEFPEAHSTKETLKLQNYHRSFEN
jgi:hypothetical protein